MSKENVKLFFEKVKTDEKLQQQLKDILNENNKIHASKVIEVAAKNGYQFNQEDIRQLTKEKLSAMVESGELSEEDMEAVAGGVPYINLVTIDLFAPTFVPDIPPIIDTGNDSLEDEALRNISRDGK